MINNEQPLINILVRISRPDIVARCLASVYAQTYKNWNIIYSYEDGDFPKWVERMEGVPVTRNAERFGYNLYLNDLKAQVKEGWWFVLDDDDMLAGIHALEDISKYLTDPNVPVICQFLRNGRRKPSDLHMERKFVVKGVIGMPCLFLHCNHNGIANFVSTEDADYLFIKHVSEKLKCKFVNRVVVDAGARGFGDRSLGFA